VRINLTKGKAEGGRSPEVNYPEWIVGRVWQWLRWGRWSQTKDGKSGHHVMARAVVTKLLMRRRQSVIMKRAGSHCF
jgi:hypothetical protein